MSLSRSRYLSNMLFCGPFAASTLGRRLLLTVKSNSWRALAAFRGAHSHSVAEVAQECPFLRLSPGFMALVQSSHPIQENCSNNNGD